VASEIFMSGGDPFLRETCHLLRTQNAHLSQELEKERRRADSAEQRFRNKWQKKLAKLEKKHAEELFILNAALENKNKEATWCTKVTYDAAKHVCSLEAQMAQLKAINMLCFEEIKKLKASE
jgi:chromosome segregation ATPase